MPCNFSKILLDFREPANAEINMTIDHNMNDFMKHKFLHYSN